MAAHYAALLFLRGGSAFGRRSDTVTKTDRPEDRPLPMLITLGVYGALVCSRVKHNPRLAVQLTLDDSFG
ncbi:hypothetical protein ZHAS_00021405 [Anopheles sinensis]|uniref:Uncharacterized protein n=1 Tax=Anopheles sinensis TaxID=74873 RepID=A0A084WSB7_ANOSI|nr:hypothetical protein ZHAS_00021405 [Anopheles sinensis]